MSDRPPEPGAETKNAGKTTRRGHRARSMIERGFVRLVANVGIVGIGVGIGAILGSGKVQGWIIGLVVAVATIVLAALLSGSRLLRREADRPPARRS